MSHRFKKTTPSTALYRHFAIITVVCTGLLAVFADGENTKAVAQSAEQMRLEKEAREAERNKHTVPAQIQQPGGMWGDDGDGTGFGTASLTTGQGFSAVSARLQANFYGRYSPDFIGRLSAQERDDLMRSMAENGADGSSLSSARASSLEDASRRRSGSLGIQ